MTSRRQLLLLAASSVAVAPSAWAKGEADAARVLAQRIDDLYREADTFKARFRQTFVLRASQHEKVAEGRVAAARGARLSFRYEQPSGDRVVSDGERIKLYEREEKRMYVMKLARARHAVAVSFLFGSLRLAKDFRLRLLDPGQKRVKRGAVLEATPKREEPLLARLVLYVDPMTAQVLRVLVIDAQGNTNRFDFDQRVFDVELPEAEFRFTPPRGTRVISQ